MSYDNPLTRDLVAQLYHDENNDPIVLTPSQLEIFDTIAGRRHKRVWVGTYTQFGKSLTVGLGVLTRVTHFPERWTIVAPTGEQAKIIMGYIIDHIFDNEAIAKKFEIEKGESADRIRREKSKNKLTFKLADGGIGGVQILSAQGTRVKDVMKALLGFGSKNVILDESSILPDEHMAGVFRMLGGNPDAFLMQIGNAIYRNHFYKASKNPRYHKIRVDWRQGVKEGRITEEFINEMREEMRPEIFRVLYDVKFPEADAIDADGYSPLLTQEEVEQAQRDDVQMIGEPRAGIDVAGGGRNQTVVVIRGSTAGKVVFRSGEKDHMVLVPRVCHYLRKYKVKAEHVFVDRTGIGHGFWNILQREYGSKVVGVLAGEAAEDHPSDLGQQFENVRAMMSWRTAAWIQKGGKLKRDRGFEEAEDIRYTTKSNKHIQIKSKEKMQKEGISSPDTWDALALTFFKPDEKPRKEWKPKGYTPQTVYEGGEDRGGSKWGTNRSPKKESGPFDRYAKL
jgi:hypothetical protein